MYSEHVGDIFNTTADAIGHGVNCHGVMGAGIAKAVRAKASEQYFNRYKFVCYNTNPAGTAEEHYDRDMKIFITNLFTQVEPGPNAKYNLLVSAMTDYISNPFRRSQSIALPRIGCGIGGLDWKYVRPILQGFSYHINIEVWELEGVEW